MTKIGALPTKAVTSLKRNSRDEIIWDNSRVMFPLATVMLMVAQSHT